MCIRDRAQYRDAALAVSTDDGSCCGPTRCDDEAGRFGATLYDDTTMLPAAAVQASLGCGNPTAIAQLRAGDVVLDLGSGGGIDVLLSAARVGPTGRAFGLDMTDEVLALAQCNTAAASVT